LLLIIGAMRTNMFSNFAISYRILWRFIKWWKAHEA
jgi:hypothetical protein